MTEMLFEETLPNAHPKGDGLQKKFFVFRKKQFN